jgi:transposase InsO family protein
MGGEASALTVVCPCCSSEGRPLVGHANARLTFRVRLELVRELGAGFSAGEVARRFRVSRATVWKWAGRFRGEGVAGLQDRSSRPCSSPRQTPPGLVEVICSVRQGQGWGPHRIAWHLHLPRSTVYAVLRRAGLARLSCLHRVTREVVRYERSRPGELVHLDVKQVGRIPAGGGKRFLPGYRETRTGPHGSRGAGIDYLHVAIDDYSRYAYVEPLPDQCGVTKAAFLERALTHFQELRVRVERILTDNHLAYKSKAFKAVADTWQVRHKRTRPYRPQTNGKAEAFNKILQAEWAYQKPYTSNQERLTQLPQYLQHYNHHRPHGGINGATPNSRLVNNVHGKYN